MKTIDNLRLKVDEADKQIFDLVIRRSKLVKKIGEIKQKKGSEILDKKREKEIIDNLTSMAKKYKIDEQLIKKIWEALFKLSYKIEKNN